MAPRIWRPCRKAAATRRAPTSPVVPPRHRGSPRSAGGTPQRSPRSSGTRQVRCGTHLVLPAPPERAHLFLVVCHRDAPHTTRDVVPFDAAAGEALLAGFQRFQVVGGGE